MSDTTEFGSFTDAGEYIPRTVVENDLGAMSFEEAIDGTIVEFDDGDLVTGTVVRIDRDEVLLDIGFKSEGVIPSRELSIRNAVDPSEVVELGEEIEALVLQKEDQDGRLVLSKKRAQYEKAWGRIEERLGRCGFRPGYRSRQGRSHHRHRITRVRACFAC